MSSGSLVQIVVGYASIVVLTVLFGSIVVALTEWRTAGSYVETVRERLDDDPPLAAIVGIGAVVAGYLVIMIHGLILGVSVTPDAGTETTPLLIVISASMMGFSFSGAIVLFVGFVFGTIAFGSFVMSRLSDDTPTHWSALGIGALIVSLPVVNVTLGPCLLLCGTGAIVRQVHAQHFRTASSDSASPR